MKLVVISDLHLDASFKGIVLDSQIGRKLRYSLQQTLLNVVDLVKTSSADALLCGGDLYEHDRFSPETAALLRYAFEQIAPASVYVSPGNEDWYGTQSLYQQVEWSSNVHIFSSDRPSPAAIGSGITLWGAAHCSPSDTRNFLRDFRANSDGLNIGLFHSAVSSLAEGPEGPANASFSLEDLRASGLRHVFLGHYRRRHEAAAFTCSGSPHPLSFEEKVPAGAVLAAISPDGTVHREWRPVSDFPFHDLEIDVTDCATPEGIQDRLKEAIAELHGIARITLCGTLSTDMDFNLKDFSDTPVSLDGLLLRIGDLRPSYDVETIAKESTVRGQFIRDVLASEMDAPKRKRVLMTGLRALEGRAELEAF